MKSLLMIVIGIVIGAVGTLLLAPAAVGAGAGVGIATGMKAGACLTLQSAREKGLLSPQQAEDILRGAASHFVGTGASAPTFIGAADECAKVVAELEQSARKN